MCPSRPPRARLSVGSFSISFILEVRYARPPQEPNRGIIAFLSQYTDGVDALTAGTRPHRYRRRKCGILSVMSCLMKAADTLLCISLEDLATSLRCNKVRRRQASTSA